MNLPNKLYVCISDNNKLSLQTRDDIDEVIEKAEETNSGSLDFTSIGSINTQDITKKHFAVTFTQEGKVHRSLFYDVIQAENEQEAQAIIESKPRFQHKSLSFKKIADLSDLINEYIN